MAKNQIDITIRAFNLAKKELDSLNKQLGNVEKAGKDTGKEMGLLGKAVGAIGFAVLAKEAGQFVYESTRLAARVETLGVVTQTLGKNAGYAGSEIISLERAIQDQGITTQASRQSLALMMQAQLDLADSTDLARLAQDAAVIAGTNSSEAFQRLINVITSGNVRMARTMGMQVDFNAGYEEMAVQLGKTTDELTAQEKTQSRANTVMGEGTQIAGAYTDAMESVGKQLESTPRYWEEYKVAVGEANIGLLGYVNTLTQKVLKSETDRMNLLHAQNEAMKLNLLTEMEAMSMNYALTDGVIEQADALNSLTAKLDEYTLRREFTTEEDRMAAGMLEALSGKVDDTASSYDGAVKALDKFSKASIGAKAIDMMLGKYMEDNVLTDEELTAVENYAEQWGVKLPQDFGTSAEAFNLMSGEITDDIDILFNSLNELTSEEWDIKIGMTVPKFPDGGGGGGGAGGGRRQPIRGGLSEHAGGGPLTNVSLVGEEGAELIINGVVIPADKTKQLMALGLAPTKKYGLGGAMDIDLPPPIRTPPSVLPLKVRRLARDMAPETREGRQLITPPTGRDLRTPPSEETSASTKIATQNLAQSASLAAADMAVQEEILEVLRGLATSEDMEQAVLTAVQQAMY